MSELLDIPVITHGLWHAGSYDNYDFLGRIVGPKPWVRHAEKSFFHAFDHNYFATEFHVKLFFDELLHDGCTSENPWYDEEWEDRYTDDNCKIVRSGWPMEYMPTLLSAYANRPKRDLIVFPHRIAPEKQVEIFRDLAKHLPEFEFVVCQDQELSKHEYHNILAEAKMVFSCSLQETLGIGAYEGALLDAMPIVPDRLSYTEMYPECFKYPSAWTENWASYIHYRDYLVNHLRVMMSHYDSYRDRVKTTAANLSNNFFSAKQLLANIR